MKDLIQNGKYAAGQIHAMSESLKVMRQEGLPSAKTIGRKRSIARKPEMVFY